ncbi:MAG: ABC transporter ATP-binding protein, partial [Nitrososphaerales archaeon]|nr:ABC transporter ATP-binding protein [Nitrososphaerales archaeon]
GKTTLINLLTGKLRPDSGSIIFKGEDITKLPAHKRVWKGINRSFQIINFFPALSVFENIAIPTLSLMHKSLDIRSNFKELSDVKEKVEKILSDINLLDKKDLPAKALSHGDQRLLELGMAMATDPQLLFLDEPTAGLSPVEKPYVLEPIKRLSSEKRATFVVVEHDMDVVFSISDRIVVMHRGKIISDGKPEEIRRDRVVREVYLGEEF